MKSKTPYQEPKLDSDSFNCPHCGAFSHMRWSYCWNGSSKDVRGLKVAYCSRCDNYSVWHDDEMIFPVIIPVEMPNEDLPEDIQDDYKEASEIVNTSPRGAAALLRLAIQKLCKHLGEKGKNINDDIGSLVEKGLSKRIQQALDVVRVIGNESVHPGFLDLRDDKDTAFMLFKLVNIIAEEMISKEREIDDIYNNLPKEKLAEIKKRDS